MMSAVFIVLKGVLPKGRPSLIKDAGIICIRAIPYRVKEYTLQITILTTVKSNPKYFPRFLNTKVNTSINRTQLSRNKYPILARCCNQKFLKSVSAILIAMKKELYTILK
ncbi:MAG: hypothetical protein ACK5LL_15555 [Suipraeoptans sp.]